MQKNLGYVIPSLVIPNAANGIGYWYLGNVSLGVRATGTMWTIGADHYWYVDNTKTNYLAEIPVEDYNQQFAEMLSGYESTWTTWLTGIQADWSTFFNTEGAAFTLWFNRMKNQLSTDAAGNLQAQIDQIGYNFSDYVEPYTISSQAYAVGTYIVHNNQTFEVVKAIAQGDTFNSDETDVNHNIESRTIGETIELSANNVEYDNTSSHLTATKVQGALDEIMVTFSNALTALKNTAIAQAVGATGSTFTSVIAKLATIVNRGSVSRTLDTTTTSYTIPQGYHDGTGVVNIVTQQKSTAPSTSAQTIAPDSGKLLSSVSVSAISTQEKTVTSSTSAQTVTPDSGKYLTKVTVNAISTQEKTVTGSRSAQTVTPDSGKVLTKVTVNKYPDASGTYGTITSNGTHDMGATNNYRYVGVSVSHTPSITLIANTQYSQADAPTSYPIYAGYSRYLVVVLHHMLSRNGGRTNLSGLGAQKLLDYSSAYGSEEPVVEVWLLTSSGNVSLSRPNGGWTRGVSVFGIN